MARGKILQASVIGEYASGSKSGITEKKRGKGPVVAG